ncbi:DUF2336 domain-containing protein [Bradyrhizobium valentinum]|uniref:DUF2336 domain-containing protein n=1 Tax=Bradyrhizobium valentinum TaxID=1518501 RepID=A0A0R3KD34_9BRAD|nr:DUF2336 domain-containing protein [Bradyrhizobium valentinum]KRQ91010.1 hypothetical protein CQ10_37310 [Bradyrhizobium valentinum]KRQ99473.1 hypothetical protein CP49_20885 [Bradyrhizobium valentinum]
MPAASPNLRAELNGAEKGGPEHDAQVFGQVTDLFLSNVGRLSESQIAAVDGVLAQLIERVEATTLVPLSEAVSIIELAPRQTVRKLAFHDDVLVAGPVLRRSICLLEKDLLEIAGSRGQQHLLAICDRKMLSEALTDALMRFGDVNVSNALARNTGARFSECGYATLVGRAERDEDLAEKLGLRLDIPGSLLRELIDKVADVVRARFLTASRPVARKKTQGSAAAAAAQSSAARKAIDYTQAQSEVVALNRTGKLNDSIVNRFAVRGEYTHVVAALALKADVKVEAIEPLLEPDRVYGLIVACKAARLSWSTTTMIVRNRPDCPPSTDRELEQCVAVFESLLLSVAQWTIRFGSDRILGKKNEAVAVSTANKKVSQPA